MWLTGVQFYFGGISHPWKIFCDPASLDHGVLIVGYSVTSKHMQRLVLSWNGWSSQSVLLLSTCRNLHIFLFVVIFGGSKIRQSFLSLITYRNFCLFYFVIFCYKLFCHKWNKDHPMLRAWRNLCLFMGLGVGGGGLIVEIKLVVRISTCRKIRSDKKKKRSMTSIVIMWDYCAWIFFTTKMFRLFSKLYQDVCTFHEGWLLVIFPSYHVVLLYRFEFAYIFICQHAHVLCVYRWGRAILDHQKQLGIWLGRKGTTENLMHDSWWLSSEILYILCIM